MQRFIVLGGICALFVMMLLFAGCNSNTSQMSQAQVKPSLSIPSGEKVNSSSPDTAAPSPMPEEPSHEQPSGAAPPSPSPKEETNVSPKRIFPDIPIDHVVIVIEENHSYKQIVGGSDAPYMQSLIGRGALFTNAHGVTHPSQPNYLAIFSGSTQGVTDDSCKKPFTTANLASELLQAKLTFTGYSEDLPKVGYMSCSSKGYARKHNPWVQFTNVPEALNRPFSDFPQDFSKLPAVSFIIPNHQDDMHDGTVRQADDWLKTNLDAYVTWAQTHQSLLLVTWDEDDFAKENHIPLIVVGPMIKPGKYDEKVNHYHVLRTIEDVFHLPQLGESQNAQPITSIWK